MSQTVARELLDNCQKLPEVARKLPECCLKVAQKWFQNCFKLASKWRASKSGFKMASEYNTQQHKGGGRFAPAPFFLLSLLFLIAFLIILLAGMLFLL